MKIFREVLEKLDVSVSAGDASRLKTINDFKKILQENGFTLEKISLINGVFPEQESLKAGILGGNDKEPIGFFLNAQKKFHSISNDNQKSAPLHREDLSEYSVAWIISAGNYDVGKSVKSYFSQYRGDLAMILLTSFLINFFGLLLPLYSSFVYDKIIGNHIHETLWGIVVCVFLVIGVEFSLRILRILSSEKMALKTETDIDFGFFRRLVEADLNAMPGVAVMMEKYKQVLSYRDFISSSYLPSLMDIPFLLLYLTAIYFIGGSMIFILISFGLLVMISSAVLISPVLKYEEKGKIHSQSRFGVIADVIQCREIILGDYFHRFMENRLKEDSVRASHAYGKARYWRGFSGAFSNTISYISFVLVLAVGVYFVEDFNLTSGGLLAVSMLTSRAMSCMGSVSGIFLKYREFCIAKEALDNLLPRNRENYSPEYGKLSGDVRIENIDYHPGGSPQPVFKGVNLEFRAGEVVGIAGVPGAGKSTLLRLIAGSISPDGGRILIDNIPVQNLHASDIGKSISFKPQELCLIEGTLEENICMGRSVLSSEERKKLLYDSGLEFAFSESGLNWQTNILSRGINISGGQRQLVSLARALAYEPSLILLDEPTNGLDANLESHVAKTILSLRHKSTVFVSSHSHKILSVCDRIVVVGKGGILANGPREKIMLQSQ